MPDWKLWQGELADGKFPLERYLGGSESSAVFLTRFDSGRAAIKFVPAGQVQAGELVDRWNRAATLHHPHLIPIFAAGTCALAGMPVAYLVMEYAAENLSEVLRERPLTTDETREMLQPVADALAYLHGQGMAHGNLKPSNILAVEDSVKISSEAMWAGDPAADIRALGVTLVEALTRQPTAAQDDGLPASFREMAENCLHHDPRLRWSAARVAAWLRSPGQPAVTLPASAAPGAKPAAGKLRFRYYAAALTLIALGLAIVGGLVMRRKAAPVPSASAPAGPPPTEPSSAGQMAAPSAVPPVPQAAQDAITHRVLPDIPAKARGTVHGKATVVVKVVVDPSGNVKEAVLERGGSPYFGKLALEAARQWQFRPVEGKALRNWNLRFEISQTATQVTVRRGPP